MSDMSKEDFQKAVKGLLDSGVTKEAMAATIPVSVNTISRYESGASTPQPFARKAILDLFKELKR